MQNEAKEMRRPWDMSKSFDFAGPVSAIVPKEAVSELSSRRMDLQVRSACTLCLSSEFHMSAVLKVNGVPRQTTSLRLMIWSVPEMLARLSRYCVLEPGDVLFCGTPAGR
jgi:fumarylpyruvate hydrolase